MQILLPCLEQRFRIEERSVRQRNVGESEVAVRTLCRIRQNEFVLVECRSDIQAERAVVVGIVCILAHVTSARAAEDTLYREQQFAVLDVSVFIRARCPAVIQTVSRYGIDGRHAAVYSPTDFLQRNVCGGRGRDIYKDVIRVGFERGVGRVCPRTYAVRVHQTVCTCQILVRTGAGKSGVIFVEVCYGIGTNLNLYLIGRVLDACIFAVEREVPPSGQDIFRIVAFADIVPFHAGDAQRNGYRVIGILRNVLRVVYDQSERIFLAESRFVRKRYGERGFVLAVCKLDRRYGEHVVRVLFDNDRNRYRTVGILTAYRICKVECVCRVDFHVAYILLLGEVYAVATLHVGCADQVGRIVVRTRNRKGAERHEQRTYHFFQCFHIL